MIDMGKITIGKFYISHCEEDKDNNWIFIEKEDGEGGSFPLDKFLEMIEEFYNEYF